MCMLKIYQRAPETEARVYSKLVLHDDELYKLSCKNALSWPHLIVPELVLVSACNTLGC